MIEPRRDQQIMGIPVEQRATTRRIRTARSTTAITTISTIMRHSARRPARRWYSCAVVSSSAAPAVSTSIEDMFDSMLSVGVLAAHEHEDTRRTEYATLFLHKRAEVTEDLRELMNAGLDFADLFLALLDKTLLEGKLFWGELVLKHLRLALRRGRALGMGFTVMRCQQREIVCIQDGRTRTPLPPWQSSHLRRQSAASLRSPVAHAEMRRAKAGSHGTCSVRTSCAGAGMRTSEHADILIYLDNRLTSGACRVASFLRSSEPRFAISRVVSVRP